MKVSPITLAAVMLTAGAALAQNNTFPNRPIRFIVGFAPGGAADVTARLLAEKMYQTWGQPVVVENRTGASGIVATEIVARASPDGHTLGVVAIGHAIRPSMYSKLPYDTLKDFSYLTQTAEVAMVLVVTNGLPVSNVKELIALCKAHPDKFAFASSGNSSSPHMAMELFMGAAGIKMLHVPYKGSTAAHPDLIGGQVQVMIDTLLAVLNHVKAGKLKALAVTTKTRAEAMPELPTVAEAALPGFEVSSWGGVIGPAKLPPEILAKLHAEIVRDLKLPDVRERLARLGAQVVGSSPAEFRNYVTGEVEKWQAIVKSAGIKSE